MAVSLKPITGLYFNDVFARIIVLLMPVCYGLDKKETIVSQ